MKNVRHKFIGLCLGLGLLALAPVQVNAKGYAAAVSPTATGVNIKFASNGTPMATLGPTAGGVSVAQTVGVAVNSTTMAQVAAAGAVTGAAMGGPIGAAIATVGSVAVFAIPAFADAFARAKARVAANGTFEKQDTTVCSVAPCYEYQGANNGVWYSNLTSAAANSVGVKPADCSGFSIYRARLVSVQPPTGYTFQWDYCGTSNPALSNGTSTVSRRSAAPSPVAWIPATQAEVIASITANAPTAAEVQALVDFNFPPEVAPVSTSGPAELPLFNTVKLGIDGTKTTTQETAKFSYFPDSVKVEKKVTQTVEAPAKTQNVVTTNPDGSTSTGVITTPAKTTVSETVEGKPQDDRTDCERYPDASGCVKLGDAPAPDPLSKKTSAVSVVSVAFAGGSCPPPIAFTAMGHSYGFSYSPMCDRLAVLKYVFLAIAGVMAAFILADSFKV